MKWHQADKNKVYFCSVEIINNKARHNLMNVKYFQMVFRSVGGAVVRSFWEPLGDAQSPEGDYMKFVV